MGNFYRRFDSGTPPIKDPLRKGQSPKDTLLGPSFIFLTSEKRKTSRLRTKQLAPKCPLQRGSTIRAWLNSYLQWRGVAKARIGFKLVGRFVEGLDELSREFPTFIWHSGVRVPWMVVGKGLIGKGTTRKIGSNLPWHCRKGVCLFVSTITCMCVCVCVCAGWYSKLLTFACKSPLHNSKSLLERGEERKTWEWALSHNHWGLNLEIVYTTGCPL